MSKVTVTPVSNLGGNPTSAQNTINDNFDALQEQIDELVSRDGEAPNTMQANLDMNSKRLLNLPYAATGGEPVTLAQLEAYVEGGTTPSGNVIRAIGMLPLS